MDILYNLLRFLGLLDEPAPMRQNIKRNRVYDDFSSDDETVLGHKQVKRFRLSDIISINDNLDKDVTHDNGERNVPVQVTSPYPKDTHKSVKPDDLPGLSRDRRSMLVRKSTLTKPTETKIAAEHRKTTGASKLENKRKDSSILQVNLDEDDSDGNQQDDDVVFVEEGTTPTTSPPLTEDNHGEALNDKILSGILKALKPEENIDYQELLQLIASSKKETAKRKPISDGKSRDATSSGSPQKIQVLNKKKLNSETNAGSKKVPKVYDPVRVPSSDSSDSDVEVVPPESPSKSIKKDLERKSRNWLLELDSKYNNERKTQEKISDPRRVSDITSRVNSDQNIARSSRTDKTNTPKTQEKNDSPRTVNFTLKRNSEQTETRSSSPETIDEWLAKLDAKYFSKPKPTEKSNDARPNAAQSSKPDQSEDWLSKLESKYKSDQLKSQTKLRDGAAESESKGNTEHDATKKWLARLEAEYFLSPPKTENNVANSTRHDSSVIPKVNDKQNDVLSKHRLESRYDKDLPKSQDKIDGAPTTNIAKENSKANAARSYLPADAQNWLSELDAKYKTDSMNQKEEEPRSAKPANIDDWLADLKSRCKVPLVKQPEPSSTSRKSETEPKVNSEKSDARSHVLDTAKQRLLKLDTKHKTEQPKNQIILDDTKHVVKNLPNENSEQSEVRSFRFNTSEDLMMKLGALYDTYQQESNKKSKSTNEPKLKHRKSKGNSDMEMQCNTDFELPALTPEQEELVRRGLQPQPEDEMLIEKFNMRIHRRDLLTLSDENWLNDEVINFYMNLIMQRSEERTELPKVYATNTFFYDKLIQSGQAGLRRWTRKVDIFAYDLFLVPVNIVRHWCLCLVDFRKRAITYLDSRGQPNQECLDALLQYLKDEHQDKKKAPFDDSGWKTECATGIPQQMNGSDCGMFACTFAEFSARDAAYSFTQAHMPYLRRKAALEILTGKLLL
ncbi:hypothetical protein PYW08_000697 [Mythimna loreyi]|uniref:Uncharacterized protein n=1 Tax=Mythimna loreyi TaxID=667449 RepID=A0ACC2R3I1_9NEOP|nr:hypothetical protein PYW08_000697 [Mythimna loreyi]